MNALDLIYPAFAFVAVMILPSCVAVWAIYKTLTQNAKSPDET